VKPFAVVGGVHAIILTGIYLLAYRTTNNNGAEKIIAILAPFALAAIDLCLGLLCTVLMLDLRRRGNPAHLVAEKYMQAFVIAFGVMTSISVPACILGVIHA